MIEAVRFPALLAATVYALWQSRDISGLRGYFLAQVLYELATEPFLVLDGQRSHAYFLVYEATTCLWMLFAIKIAWEALGGRQFRLRAFGVSLAFSVPMTRLCAAGMAYPASGKAWFILIQAGVLYWIALVLGCGSIFVRRATAGLILALLWLAEAVFLWGFLMHLPEWAAASKYVPSVLHIAGFYLVGRFIRLGTAAQSSPPA